MVEIVLMVWFVMIVGMVSSLRLLEERFALGLRLEAKKFVISKLKSPRRTKRIRFASNLQRRRLPFEALASPPYLCLKRAQLTGLYLDVKGFAGCTDGHFRYVEPKRNVPDIAA